MSALLVSVLTDETADTPLVARSSICRRIDAPKFSPDNDTRRVFVFNEHAWWGALITAPGKKNERGDWTYACKLVHGKVFKAVREDKITSRDQLPLIHDQVCPLPLFRLFSTQSRH